MFSLREKRYAKFIQTLETLRNSFSRIFIFVDDSDIISPGCLASFYTQRNNLEEDAQRFL